MSVSPARNSLRVGDRFFRLFWTATLFFVGCSNSAELGLRETSVVASERYADSGVGTRDREAAGDWPCFRGPGGAGRSEADQLPLTWSQSENLAWKTPLPGPGASSPIVKGDRVYLTCYTGYAVPDQQGGTLEQLKRHVIAVRLSDGKIVWDKSFPARLPEEPSVRDHGYASSTLAADDKHVYVFFGKSGVIALDHEGHQVWQADVGSEVNGWGTAASPVLHNDLVIINAER